MSLLLSLLLAWPAFSQTTTLSSTDKNSGITLSNGNLTATAAATAAHKTGRGTIAKFSGQWCYQYTVAHAINSVSVGVADSEYPVDYNATLGNTDFVTVQYSASSAGLDSTSSGQISWHHVGAGADPPVNGKTGEVCVNLDLSPPRLWITPDVSGTGGAGGGPKWNSSATDNPAGDVGGAKFWLPMSAVNGQTTCCVFPAVNLGNADVVTVNFGASAFTPPSGYSTWNTNGGASPTPGPLSPKTIHVSNAPYWVSGGTHALKDRVLAGPGWNGTAFSRGSKLCEFAVTAGGTSGSSASAFNTACNAGAVAGYGGGQDGSIPSQWSSAATVTDGGVTWALVDVVDYDTINGLNSGDAEQWAASTGYGYLHVINNGSCGATGTCRGYIQTVGFGSGSTNPLCTSSSTPGGPSGTGAAISDGTCVWKYIGDINYSSQNNYYPHIRSPNGGTYNEWEEQIFYDVNILLMWGGAQRPEYVSNANGEALQIYLANHSSFAEHIDQSIPASCYHSGDLIFTAPSSYIAVALDTDGASPSCHGASRPFVPSVTAFPGDGPFDWIHAIRYDATFGVGLTNHGAYDGQSGWCNATGIAFADCDSFASVSDLQFHSDNGFDVHHGVNGGNRYDRVVLDSTGVGNAFGCCDDGFSNAFFILNSSNPGCFALEVKYRGPVNNVTAFGNGQANCTFYQFTDGEAGAAVWWGNNLTPWTNNLIFGFPNLFTWASTAGYSPPGHLTVDNNATDQPNAMPSSASFTSASPYGDLQTPQNLGGFPSTCGPSNASSCFGLLASDVFVNPTFGSSLDLRLKSDAPVKGAGAAYSMSGISGILNVQSGPDIFNTPRPQSARYDIGAVEFLPGAAAISRPLSGLIQ